MSDCSTNAMKPKMPPKTCGTCQHQRYCHMPAESSLAEVCARFRPEGEPTVPKYAPISETCDTCNTNLGYLAACRSEAEAIQRTDDLEQRCQQLEQKYETVLKAMVECEEQRQQLEQVAKELFGAYRRLLACYRGAVGIFNASENATPAGKFREQLEALGVSVDG